MRAVRASRAARPERLLARPLDERTGLCFVGVFFAVVSGLALLALPLPVSALALGEACAFDGGFAESCVLAAGAGADCASDGDATANCSNRTATAASAGRRTGGKVGGKVGDGTRDGESKQTIVPLYAELDASERRRESFALPQMCHPERSAFRAVPRDMLLSFAFYQGTTGRSGIHPRHPRPRIIAGW